MPVTPIPPRTRCQTGIRHGFPPDPPEGGDRKPLSFGFAKVLCWKSGGTIARHSPKVNRNYSSLRGIRLRRVFGVIFIRHGEAVYVVRHSVAKESILAFGNGGTSPALAR
jgi:hypothetical protein